jgi:methylthioribose-1-phosphate isomerase
MATGDVSSVRSIEWRNGRLFLLDQTQLPLAISVEEEESVEDVWHAIKQLKVRGAPAIGVAGAYGLVVAMRGLDHLDEQAFLAKMRSAAAYLDGSRPTAVNLSWALGRVVAAAEKAAGGEGSVSGNSASGGAASGGSASEGVPGRSGTPSTRKPSAHLLAAITAEAEAIHGEDIEVCRRIGEFGAPLIAAGAGILTHCNAGRLATSDYGTATAPMYLAHRNGVPFSVYSDESRPLLQGSRLTAWELQQAGIDVTTITDNMAAFVMQQGLIDMVIVGTDRVAANGDVANKIGTLGVAILARHFRIPFYVASPFSTIDLATPTGAEIVIEERDPDEVTSFGLRRTAPEGVQVRNPAFDVTPNELVTAIITDRGIIEPPTPSV